MKLVSRLGLLGVIALLASCATNTGVLVPPANQIALPDLSAPDQYNRQISLRDYATTDYLLIFFYPEADTPG